MDQVTILSSKLLGVGKMGKCKDLSESDKTQIVMARVETGQCGSIQETSYCSSNCLKSSCWLAVCCVWSCMGTD